MTARTADGLEDFHQRSLDWLQTMFRGGNAIAIPAALQYCSKHGLAAPAWLTAAAATSFAESLRGGVASKQGRSSSTVDRYRQDMTDFTRWEEVKTVREKQVELLEEVRFLRANPKRAEAWWLEDREKMLIFAGRSLKDAFECAAVRLAKTSAFGGADAIRTSYFAVEKVNRTQSQPLRYHLLDPTFLASIGISP
jgi:hypothetical protein